MSQQTTQMQKNENMTKKSIWKALSGSGTDTCRRYVLESDESDLHPEINKIPITDHIASALYGNESVIMQFPDAAAYLQI